MTVLSSKMCLLQVSVVKFTTKYDLVQLYFCSICNAAWDIFWLLIIAAQSNHVHAHQIPYYCTQIHQLYLYRTNKSLSKKLSLPIDCSFHHTSWIWCKCHTPKFLTDAWHQAHAIEILHQVDPIHVQLIILTCN